jgi:signal transduction histidine kinase
LLNIFLILYKITLIFLIDCNLIVLIAFLLFLLITCAGLLWKRKGIPIVKFIIILVLPFIFLNWQPWINRLLLPVFTIVTIYLVMLYSENFASKASKVILSAISIAMFSSSLAYISLSNSRGFPNFHLSGVGSSSQYFNVHPKLATPYLELQRFLSERNFSDISLVGNEDSWEYPVLQQNPKINFSWNDPSTRIVLCLSACGNLRKSNLRVLASFDQNLVLYKRVN